MLNEYELDSEQNSTDELQVDCRCSDGSIAVADFNEINFQKEQATLWVAKVSHKARLSILGLGYVGAVSAACFSDRGHDVIGVDPDKNKVATLNRGESPIVEEGLGDMLEKSHESGRLIATSDVVKAVRQTDITLVSVGTPTSEEGVCSLVYLRKASEQIGRALKRKNDYHLIVYRSTVPPKTTRETMIPILEKASGKCCGKDFGVCFNPEFLRESTAIKDFYSPPKTVIGAIDERSGAYAAKLYEGISGELIQTNLEAAEFVKYIDNTWHALKVSFGNEVGRLCKAVGVDSHEVMDIFVKDTKLNLSPYYLKPGFAFGGSCLPKDTRGIMHMAETEQVETPLINSIIASNNHHIDHALRLIKQTGVKSVGFMGVTFKAGTDDLRESPVLELMKQLHAEGYQVHYYDEKTSPACLLGAGLELDVCESNCQHYFELIRKSGVVVMTQPEKGATWIAKMAKLYKPVIDLVGLSDELKGNHNYQGICW